MVISLSGTHCTGKTTLVNALKEDPFFQNAVFLDSSGKGLSHLGIKINQGGDDISQLYFASKDLKQTLESQNEELVILDRSIIDTWIYTKYLYSQDKVSTPTMTAVSVIKNNLVKLIDHVFLLEPSFELVREAERSMNKGFQDTISGMFRSEFLLSSAFLPDYSFLPNSLESRIETIKNYIISHKQ